MRTFNWILLVAGIILILFGNETIGFLLILAVVFEESLIEQNKKIELLKKEIKKVKKK